MRSVTDFIDALRGQYGGSLDFKRLCVDKNIHVVKANLPKSVNGFTSIHSSHKIITLNKNLPRVERYDSAAHELWHALRNGLVNHKEEAKADLFAALFRAPEVHSGDDLESLRERYDISYRLAKIRIEYEIQRMRLKALEESSYTIQ